MNAISSTNVIHLVRCSWCNKLGHELTSCPHWIGCIAHERDKQARLEAMQPERESEAYGTIKGMLSGFLVMAVVYGIVAYIVLR